MDDWGVPLFQETSIFCSADTLLRPSCLPTANRCNGNWSLTDRGPAAKADQNPSPTKRIRAWPHGILGVSINGGTPKWIVYEGKSIKMDDLGIPPVMEALISVKQHGNPTRSFSLKCVFVSGWSIISIVKQTGPMDIAPWIHMLRVKPQSFVRWTNFWLSLFLKHICICVGLVSIARVNCKKILSQSYDNSPNPNNNSSAGRQRVHHNLLGFLKLVPWIIHHLSQSHDHKSTLWMGLFLNHRFH